MLTEADYNSGGIPSILEQLGEEALAKNTAYLRGEVISRRGELLRGSKMDAIYITSPSYFPEGFHKVIVEALGAVIFAWLIPIYASEVKFIEEKGWGYFEDRLVESNPDLLDFARPAVV